ncbi:hypothetical protein [Kingella potus]|uniref:hypothetical protein n=1 Tax=Kingella potus TaxID=265175 RepID=UPI001FD32F40|nr:hypothetical protein [Kingella potus]UOP00091.1 hypothetical protein LVJ84_08935 [Kingella potus]
MHPPHSNKGRLKTQFRRSQNLFSDGLLLFFRRPVCPLLPSAGHTVRAAYAPDSPM